MAVTSGWIREVDMMHRRTLRRFVNSGRRRSIGPALALLSMGLAATMTAAAAPDVASQNGKNPGWLELSLRSRETSPGLGGASRVVEKPATWDAARTAIIVCDMWDLHHCLNATRRGVELAPRMNQVLENARTRGVVIIHAPSSCMDAYKDHPARKRAQTVPRSKNLPAEIGQWCRKIPSEEQGSYPVDQIAGGEDDDLPEHARWAARLASIGRDPRTPWKSQTDKLTIDPRADYISDDGNEIWSILDDRGIDNVILMGVHLNMCVLGRPFGLRQMAKNGKNVALMRDMTDTMYDPSKAPFVSHFSGTDRVIEHVERFVCPSLTSNQLVGGRPFRFRGDTRPHVVFLIAEDEYKTQTTLPPFAAKYLARDYRVSFVFESTADKNDLPGTGVLDDADLLVVSARRRVLPRAQLAAVRRLVAAGKPVFGIRTASHAFAARPNTAIPSGFDTWPEFDPEVLGGHYVGHYKPEEKVAIATAPAAATHPILTGVDVSALVGNGSLYRVNPLASSTTPLLIGTIAGQPAEPVLWTNVSATGGRVVYTSLGHPDDFAEPAFQRLLRNAIDWTAGRDVAEKLETASTDPIPFPR
jgi:nicotinamidase-related amidase/type 1 glutamine amidotransferase